MTRARKEFRVDRADPVTPCPIRLRVGATRPHREAAADHSGVAVSASRQDDTGAVASLAPLIRNVVRGRLEDTHVDDVVQETLVRVIAARARLDDEALAPYAIVVARNLVNNDWVRRDRARRHAHRLADVAREDRGPEAQTIEREAANALASALRHLSEIDRESLVA